MRVERSRFASPMPKPQRLPASIRGPSTIYRETVSIDKTTLLLVRKKSDGRGDVVCSCEAPHRNPPCDVRVGVDAASLISIVHLRLHPAWAHCIHAHASATPLSSERSRQAN